MNVKAIFAVLLMLCGAGLTSLVHAADFNCLVYSGANGTQLEKSQQTGGTYKIKATDTTAAAAKALEEATRYKKGAVVLTRAECKPAVAASSTTAPTQQPSAPEPAPAPAPAPTETSAPSTGGTRFYCMVYEEGTNEHLKVPAGMGEEDIVWWVPSAGLSSAEEDAVALATSKGLKADSAQCASSLERLGSY